MDWKDIAGAVGKAAPILGTLLGGPAGAAIGGIVASALGTEATPDAVSQALTVNPEAAVKLREVEATQRVKLQELAVTHAAAQLQAATQNAGDINKTMQAEAAAEHWPSYSWRPAIGFAVALDLMLGSLVVAVAYGGVMFGGANADVLTYLPAALAALTGLVAVASPILGIASWHRGKRQANPNIPPARQLPFRGSAQVPPVRKPSPPK